MLLTLPGPRPVASAIRCVRHATRERLSGRQLLGHQPCVLRLSDEPGVELDAVAVEWARDRLVVLSPVRIAIGRPVVVMLCSEGADGLYAGGVVEGVRRASSGTWMVRLDLAASGESRG